MADQADSLPRLILSGSVDGLPSPKKNIVKIFLSSTFSDMYVERNYLLAHIYPRLQSYCRERYNLEFQVVDMRWGVRDDASLDHSGPQVCMDELTSCLDCSLGPNFVCLLGQRYGARPPPLHILKSEFDIILQSLHTGDGEDGISNEKIELLTDWYKCDYNTIPPVMVLTPLNEQTNPVSVREFSQISKRLEKIMRLGVKRALRNNAMSLDIARKFLWSVTEEEIYRGVLTQPNAQDHAICFVRRLVNVNYKHSLAGKFVDLSDGKVDTETSSLLDTLVEQTLQALGVDNSFIFDNVPWCDNSGTNAEDLSDYLLEFGELFESKVKMLIDRAANTDDHLRSHPHAQLLYDIAEHSNVAASAVASFGGRYAELESIKEYIQNRSSNCPLVIHGRSGCGKSSILAKASIDVQEWFTDMDSSKQVLVVRRFVGTTPESSNVLSLLQSVTQQISSFCRFQLEGSNESIQRIFKDCIESVPSQYHVLICLDSLDLLAPYDNAYEMKWLPRSLPSNVRILVSTLTEEHNILQNITQYRQYPERYYLQIHGMGESFTIETVTRWLSRRNHKLTDDQISAVKSRLEDEDSKNPLFIKLLLNGLLKTRSYMPTSQLQEFLHEIRTTDRCIVYILNSTIKRNGSLLVLRLFAYLHLSNAGLSETELIDLISLDDDVLNDVFQYSSPPIRRLPAVLWAKIRNDLQDYIITQQGVGGKVVTWSNRKFGQIAHQLYTQNRPAELTEQQYSSKLRSVMIEYFTGQWADGKPKPFMYTDFLTKKLGLSSPTSSANRLVPSMRNMLENGKPNLRKISNLPVLLLANGQYEAVILEIICKFEGLIALFSTLTWAQIMDLFNRLLDDKVGLAPELHPPVKLLQKVLYMSMTTLIANPMMVAPLVLGRILTFVPGSPLLQTFVNEAYQIGSRYNAFICPHAQLESVGLEILFDLSNEHSGPCVDVMLVRLKDNTPYLVSISRRLMVFNMTDGSIPLKYSVRERRSDDLFSQLEAISPLDNPSEIYACMKIKPQIFIVSLRLFEVSAVIDCSSVPGCELFRVTRIKAFRIGTQSVISAQGRDGQGLLLFSAESRELLHRFNGTYLFVTHIEDSLILTDLKKRNVYKLQAVGQSDEISLTKVSKETLSLPHDSQVLCSSETLTGRFVAISLMDGGVMIGDLCPGQGNQNLKQTSPYCSSQWTRLLVDSSAHHVNIQETVGEDCLTLTVCTKEYIYLYTVHPQATQKENSNGRFHIEMLARARQCLSYLNLYKYDGKADIRLVGYNMETVYTYNIYRSKSMGERVKPVKMKLMKVLHMHSKPINKLVMLTGESVSSIATASADGSVRSAQISATVLSHPLFLQSNTFDKMKNPAALVSASSDQTACISHNSREVVLWSWRTGEITGSLVCEEMAEVDYIVDILAHNHSVIVVTSNGVVFFWSLFPVHTLQSTENVADYLSMILKDDNSLLLLTKEGFYVFSIPDGQVVMYKHYDQSQVVSSGFASGQLTLLLLRRDSQLCIEVFQSDNHDSKVIQLPTSGVQVEYGEAAMIKDFVAVDHMMVLQYHKEVIFYNWCNQDVLLELKMDRPELVKSLSNHILVKNGRDVTSYRLDRGVQTLSSLVLKKRYDKVQLTPDGNYLLRKVGSKTLRLYRVEDLSSPIGEYALYGCIDKIAISSDSRYVALSITDCRIFFLILQDYKVQGHMKRSLELIRDHYSEEEKERATLMLQLVGEGKEKQQVRRRNFKHVPQINELAFETFTDYLMEESLFSQHIKTLLNSH